MTAGLGGIMGAGGTVLAGGAIAAGTVGSVALAGSTMLATMVSAAIGGFAGSLASQAVGKAMGAVEHFCWS